MGGDVIYAKFSWESAVESPSKTEGVMYIFNYDKAPNENRFLLDRLSVGEVIGKLPYDPEREGYEFLGWSRDAEGTRMLSNSDVKEETTIVLFAQWAKK